MSATSTSNKNQVILKRLAARALGMTGADIERAVKEARSAARRQKRSLSTTDLEAAIRQHRPKPSPDRLLEAASHEAGHALVHYLLSLGPIHGVTIDDASGDGYGALGFDTQKLARRDWFEDMLTMLMAGRAAEALVFLEAGTGAGGADDSDLARATTLAFALERTLGLGQELPLLYRPHPNPTLVLDANPKLAARVHGHLERAEERAGRLISEKRRGFDALVSALISAYALEGVEVERILKDAGVHPIGLRPCGAEDTTEEE